MKSVAALLLTTPLVVSGKLLVPLSYKQFAPSRPAGHHPISHRVETDNFPVTEAPPNEESLLAHFTEDRKDGDMAGVGHRATPPPHEDAAVFVYKALTPSELGEDRLPTADEAAAAAPIPAKSPVKPQSVSSSLSDAAKKPVEPMCAYNIDLLQVIDSTYSVFSTIPKVRSELSQVLKLVLGEMPAAEDNRVAMATFTDKPIEPLGFNRPGWKDVCLSLKTNFDSDYTEQVNALNGVYVAGGYDFPEAQAEAMLRSALSPQVHWRTETHTASGNPLFKVLLVVTDSIMHLPMNATDAFAKQNDGEKLPANNLKSADLATDINAKCGEMEYPSLAQLRKAFDKEMIIPIFLLSPAHYPCGAGKMCRYPELNQLYKWTGDEAYLDASKGMEAFYTYVAQSLNRPAVIQMLGDGFEGFADKLTDALEELGLLACVVDQSTTEMPTEPETQNPGGWLSTEEVTTMASSTDVDIETPATEDTCECPHSPCCPENIKVIVNVDVIRGGDVNNTAEGATDDKMHFAIPIELPLPKKEE